MVAVTVPGARVATSVAVGARHGPIECLDEAARHTIRSAGGEATGGGNQRRLLDPLPRDVRPPTQQIAKVGFTQPRQ